MKTTNKGIDYGNGLSNCDHETGIRFGVIPSNALMPEASHDIQDKSTDLDYCDYNEPHPNCTRYLYEKDGYKLKLCGGDIFVLKSPFYTHAQFCSPCAPGACYLLNPCQDGAKAYCLRGDWFDDQVCPYPVYEVATGKLLTEVA